MNNTYFNHLNFTINERKNTLKNILDILVNNKQKIINSLYLDLHKPQYESYFMEILQIENEIKYHLDYFESWLEERKWISPFKNMSLFFSGMGHSYVQRKPFGNVLIIGAWNYPLNLSLMPLIGAISAGNKSMVILPDFDYTHHTTNLLIKLFNIPKLNKYVIFSNGGEKNVKKMLKYKWDLIFYTGSKKVGKFIYESAASQLTPTILELGGKSPCVIDEEINELLVRRIVWGKLTNSGQTCIAPDYFLVKDCVKDKFLKMLVKTINEFYGKDPQKSECYARIINSKSLNRLKNIIDNDKPFLYHGGKIDIKNLYIEPTIIDFKNDKINFHKSACMADEIFGPIFPIYSYNNVFENIEIINKYKNPLTAYLFCKNSKGLSEFIKSGSIVINDTLMQMNSSTPFGGIGDSGIGNYHGKYSFDSFTYQKSILKRYKYGEINLRFPPYTKIKYDQLLLFSKYVTKKNRYTLLLFLLGFILLRKAYISMY